LATYAAGGTFTETNTEVNANSSGSALGLTGSDGHGAWKKEGAILKTTFRKLSFLLLANMWETPRYTSSWPLTSRTNCPAASPSLLLS
jgi:hypothetical protein